MPLFCHIVQSTNQVARRCPPPVVLYIQCLDVEEVWVWPGLPANFRERGWAHVHVCLAFCAPVLSRGLVLFDLSGVAASFLFGSTHLLRV